MGNCASGRVEDRVGAVLRSVDTTHCSAADRTLLTIFTGLHSGRPTGCAGLAASFCGTVKLGVDAADPIEVLSQEDCWELLLSSSLGRLAVSVTGEPEIFPVNFLATGRRLLVHTSPGTKLVELTLNSRVAFETDHVGADEAWSVVVKGTARVLEKQSEIDAADELSLRSLMPTVKYVYVEIVPQELAGRRFRLRPEGT